MIPKIADGLVATREGGVDRNPYSYPKRNFLPEVATREGGVDRNYGFVKLTKRCTIYQLFCPVVRVATREGGVDRNEYQVTEFINGILVATREGGVDRN